MGCLFGSLFVLWYDSFWAVGVICLLILVFVCFVWLLCIVFIIVLLIKV